LIKNFEDTKIKLLLPALKKNPIMSFKTLLFIALSLLLLQQSFSQRNYEEYNRLGIQGGISLFDIATSDFSTKQAEGFFVGFTTRGAFRNNFDIVYGINFLSTEIGILGHDQANTGEISDEQYIDYAIQAVQLNFLASYNIVKHHLSVEAGPILHINSKMKLKSDRHENYIIDGYSNLRAEDLQDISVFNFRLMGGITAGLESFRLSAQYQYGVTNMLDKLNDQNLEMKNFKGNSGTIILALIVYF
jgi:hypothetical protein